jgi:hypothetical protein
MKDGEQSRHDQLRERVRALERSGKAANTRRERARCIRSSRRQADCVHADCARLMAEPLWRRLRRLGKPDPNPVTLKRAANQRARYLNDRQSAAWRGHYDRAGNSTYISMR